MSDTEPFALIVFLTAAVGLVAVLSNRFTERLKVPPPALVLVGAAVAVKVIPSLHAPPQRTVERVVTLALLGILFDGGLHIGRRRLRSAAAPIAVVGVLGTFLTAGAGALLAHLAFGLHWYVSLLVATAVAPTDPAVVFSVLGNREISGRGGTILEGESGANDPVGIALMASLITAGGLSAATAGQVGGEFLLQMGVGLAVGVVGGRSLLWFMRGVALPSEGLYPLRTLSAALLLFGLAGLAHGSGFLAVFVAGIMLGDEPAPYKREIERFHSALASLGEIIAFVVLGLTVDLGQLTHTNVWVPGIILAAALAFVIRPVLVGLCLIPASLPRNERNFVLFAGLKGAVPILLGSYLFAAHVPDAKRLYGIVVVVVIFSVFVQAGLAPAVARLLHLSMRTIEPEPWAFGVRLQAAPDGVFRFTIEPGSAADRRRIGDLGGSLGDAWISLVLRGGQILAARGETELRAGDDVVILAGLSPPDDLRALFLRPVAD